MFYVLHNWGQFMVGALWVHYIDNAAALATLVRGSSSILCGDVIVGYTWKKISSLNVGAWFERVSSAANPVDGLSRGSKCGPWREVQQLEMPLTLLGELAEHNHSV